MAALPSGRAAIPHRGDRDTWAAAQPVLAGRVESDNVDITEISDHIKRREGV